MMSRISPCLHCKKRKIGCHSTCADYLDYDAEKKKISEERQKENIFRGYHGQKSEQIKKKMKQNREEK